MYDREEDFVANYTADVSDGGLFIRTSQPLDVGTEFSVVCRVPGVPDAVLSRVRVAWIRSDEPPGMGVRFLFEDEAHRAAVARAFASSEEL